MSIKDERRKELEKELDKEIREYTLEEVKIMNSLDKKIEENRAYTDNQAVVYKTTNSNLVDFNFGLSTMRAKTEDEIADEFAKIYKDDKEVAMRYLFFVRDVREGLGERKVFSSIMKRIAQNEPDIARSILPLIPEYGRWDEVVNLLDTPIRKDAVSMIRDQLTADMKASMDGKPISLCAKWLPSINASNAQTRKNALILCKELNMEKKDYRHMLSGLRDSLNIIEKALAEKDVDKLESMQEILTSKQNYKYKDVLMRLMPEKRTDYFNRVLKGEANFNVSVLEPHEIYYRYRSTSKREPFSWRHSDVETDLSYEVMWKMLPNKVQSDKEVLVVRDGSGSMEQPIPGTNNGTILDVASALTVYFAEHTTGQFKDKFITFGSSPELVDMSDKATLAEKINLLNKHTDCSSTNLEATFDLILETAKDNGLKQEELPANLLIVSDMQFNSASTSRGMAETLLDTIRAKFEKAGYKMPGLIFWNVAASKVSIPEVHNENGLVLLSGYSKNNIDMICANDFTQEIVDEKGNVQTVTKTPEEILMERIMSNRYDAISASINPILEAQIKSNPEIGR